MKENISRKVIDLFAGIKGHRLVAEGDMFLACRRLDADREKQDAEYADVKK